MLLGCGPGSAVPSTYWCRQRPDPGVPFTVREPRRRSGSSQNMGQCFVSKWKRLLSKESSEKLKGRGKLFSPTKVSEILGASQRKVMVNIIT